MLKKMPARNSFSSELPRTLHSWLMSARENKAGALTQGLLETLLTTPALLLGDVGVVLYGKTWRPEMARRRNVSSITVRQWERGSKVIPDRVWVELRDELRNTNLVIEELLERLPP